MKKRVLFIDCLMRGHSRTHLLSDAFFDGLNKDRFQVHTLKLRELDLQPLANDFYAEREELLAAQDLDHPRFQWAKLFAASDLIVIAAPFWDLSFPSLLKMFIENVCVEGITFRSDETGLHGLCRADKLVYLTTRGGFIETGSPLEQATPYLKALSQLLGYGEVITIAASGMDVRGYDVKNALRQAMAAAKKTAEQISAE